MTKSFCPKKGWTHFRYRLSLECAECGEICRHRLRPYEKIRLKGDAKDE